MMGDLVDGEVDVLCLYIVLLVGMLVWYGVYVVMGNYEYYLGVGFWVLEFEWFGMCVLMNEYVVFEYNGVLLVIVGVIDFSVGKFDVIYVSDLIWVLVGLLFGVIFIILFVY